MVNKLQFCILLIFLALWVMWGLLCGHLVAFKAPKSWPNKFLINVWGGFSVIFVASYTANIAALIAGLFFHNISHNYDTSVRILLFLFA
jgi:ionotropic glutamate receptor NMDA 3A